MLHENNSDFITKKIQYFFLISHGIPFLMTVILMILEGSIFISQPFFNQIIYIAFSSPLVAAGFIISLYYSKEEKNNYWLSIIDFSRIPWKIFLFILLFPVSIRFFASLIAEKLFITDFQFDLSPQMNLVYIIILLFFGPVPEELGWRGVALPLLQKRFGFQKAAIFLGLMWAVWHLPLFFFQGTFQYQFGLFSPLFWNYMLATIFTSIILSVIFNESNNSILAVILFHYMENLTGQTFTINTTAEIISNIVRGIVAIIIFIHYGRKYSENHSHILERNTKNDT